MMTMNETADSNLRCIDHSRPVPGLSLPVKLLLAVISGYCMWPASELGERLDNFLPINLLSISWSVIFGGALFGALVMAPLITARSLRLLRIVALCFCSIVTYRIALEVAVDGPFGRAAFAAAGLIGAELVAIAVVILAPINLSWRMFVFAGVAGAAGGELFGHLYDMKGDFPAATAYAVWQILVCLALNLGARDAANHQPQSASL